MNLINLKYSFILIPVLLLFLTIIGYTQTDTSINKIDAKIGSEIDTSKVSSKLELVRKIGENAIKQVVSENMEKQIHFRQMALPEELDKELNKVNERFKRGIDTVFINKEIKLIEEQFRIAAEGTLSMV